MFVFNVLILDHNYLVLEIGIYIDTLLIILLIYLCIFISQLILYTILFTTL